jgi:hypothetical protein
MLASHALRKLLIFNIYKQFHSKQFSILQTNSHSHLE